jgi:hypothetical protein
MAPKAHHRTTSRWLLTLGAVLGLAPGCSGSAEPADELVRVEDDRGISTYRYVPRKRSPATAPRAESSPRPQDDLLVQMQQERADTEDRERQYALDQQRLNRELDERRRQEDRELQARRDEWLRNNREQMRLAVEQRRAYQQQTSQWAENQRLKAEADEARRQKDAQDLNEALLRVQGLGPR